MGRDVVVKEAMKTNLAMVNPSTTVLEASQLMKERKIGNVIVVEKKQPIGILTESDILKKVVAEGKAAKDVFVKDVMSTPIIVVDPYVSLEEAMKIMGKCNVRRLPVIEKGELIGIITQKDISRLSPVLHEISREWYDISVRDKSYFDKQVFSGKCEDCGALSSNLKNIDGKLLCEDCADTLNEELHFDICLGRDEMKVSEIMAKDIITVAKDDNLKHVLKLMKKHSITKIPVVENKKPIGMATDNAIAYELGSIRKKGIPPSRFHASSVTEKEIECIPPDTDVNEILEKVGKPGPTMLCVVDKDRLVGVLTKADLLHLVNSKRHVREIMNKHVHTVFPDDRVIHARRVMIDQKIARLPVVDKGKLVGVISDTEIAFALADIKETFPLGRQKHQLEELFVKDVMKSPAFWIEPSVSAKDAAYIMMKNNVGALPLLENNRLIGIVTRTDLLKTIRG